MDERRYYGLDALRGGMMMLGIILHSAMFYLASPPPALPLITDRSTSYLMDVLVDFIHAFRMPTFFVLAGFFASLLVDKRGLLGTYKNRLARIAGPLLAAWLTVLPLSLLLMLDFMLRAKYGSDGILPLREDLDRLERHMDQRGVPSGIPLGHLWFLYFLLYFYLLIPLCRWLVARAEPRREAVGRLLRSPYSFALLSLVTAATLWPYAGAQVFGVFVFLTPHVPSLLFYGFFFVFGYVLHSHRDFLGHLARLVPKMALLALVLFPLSLLTTHLEYAQPPGSVGVHLVAVVVHGFCTWTLVYLAIGCALRYFDRESPWSLYASQSSYWVFLVHMPAVCLAAWWLVPYELPALVKFALVALATTLFCFTTYHYWVQNTWVSDFLNGRRFDLDWPWRKPPVRVPETA